MSSEPSTTRAVSGPPPDAGGGTRPGPWLVWFAVLGGPLAWAVHVVVAWLLVELACVQGNDEVLGLPLRGVVAAATAGPGAVTVAALLAAWLVRRAVRAAQRAGRGGSRLQRVAFMVEIAWWSNLLAAAMVLMGGVAVAVLPGCST